MVNPDAAWLSGQKRKWSANEYPCSALSKKCPMCDTVNDSQAESCKYCGYIFEDVASESPRVAPSNASDVAPANVARNDTGTQNQSFNSFTPEINTSTAAFVIKNSWKDRRNIPSLIIAVLVILFYVANYVPAIQSGSFSAEDLIFLVIPVIFILPLITVNKTFEFYADHLSVNGLGSHQTILYTQIDSVTSYRGRTILQLKDTWRQIRIQGNVKSNSTGQDLVTWLNQKIKQPERSGKVSTEN